MQEDTKKEKEVYFREDEEFCFRHLESLQRYEARELSHQREGNKKKERKSALSLIFGNRGNGRGRNDST